MPVNRDIDEQWRRANSSDGRDSRKKRERRYDDSVARTDSHGHERQQERIAAGSDTDGMVAAKVNGHLVFETFDRGAEDELLRFGDFVYRVA